MKEAFSITTGSKRLYQMRWDHTLKQAGSVLYIISIQFGIPQRENV